MSALSQLRVKIFADSAERARMLELRTRSYIRGFTTNPTLMRRSGVTDYRAFARDILSVIADKPVCFEVLADEFPEMERQALEIASWSDNVYDPAHELRRIDPAARRPGCQSQCDGSHDTRAVARGFAGT